jgi:hypothetical protein
MLRHLPTIKQALQDLHNVGLSKTVASKKEGLSGHVAYRTSSLLARHYAKDFFDVLEPIRCSGLDLK